MEQGKYAFVTLATDDSYSKGALVLAHSLRRSETKAKLVVLVTDGVSNAVQDTLNKVFDVVQSVSELDSKDDDNLKLLGRPELGVSFTKIHCWKLTQFSKCVFLDADTLVLKNSDELFEKSELSAAPDIGWPDCFNSGVFVFVPSNETYNGLLKMAADEGSFDGGDQGLLNMYFKDWSTKDISNHLSFIYNMNVNASYTYLPAYNKFGKDVKIVHFLGTQKKPWMYKYDHLTGSVDAPRGNYPLYEYLSFWWKIFNEECSFLDTAILSITQSLTDCSIASVATASSKSSQSTPANTPTDEELQRLDDQRLHDWEKGNIDYLHRDSFENIQRKLDEAINGKSPDKSE
ncbi:hypothetical protein JTE90_025931 [Oedothorax gibbosus]|uniref:glycogenin glucosyltransferase n=1 Tax=Oedothorax gibbosus TaxID=931172 RepID=A0AAV6UB39_9ARAC|nr:hypothetical protein JTE90_025931 [Oedothorax gibbosus]